MTQAWMQVIHEIQLVSILNEEQSVTAIQHLNLRYSPGFESKSFRLAWLTGNVN